MIQLSADWKRLKEDICTEFQMKNARSFNKIGCYIKVNLMYACTLKEENVMGRKCRKSRQKNTFKQKVTSIECRKNSIIKMSREFKVTN